MNFIGNAFSLNMMESAKLGLETDFRVTKMDKEDTIRELKHAVEEYKSVLGHKDIAQVVSMDLDYVVRFNRETIKLRDGDNMIVCQYVGPRLPEGTTKLPSGAQIDYYLVVMGV